jgi:transcriptional regulator with PAS, ATPase and Fis domain
MSTAPHPHAQAIPIPRLIGESPAMRRLSAQLESLGSRSCTVLLRGETGTGKELAARLIHARSHRANGPFVPVDSTTLRDTLFESQLFGHTRGAFTGADRATLGFFRAADGGTLFLDEIGELPLQSQAKLLRCIQERQVVPLGATTGIAADVRVIAATHRDLSEMVRHGEFREDLFYRLNVAALRLPPLRERIGDIPQLVRHALDELARLYQEAPRLVTDEAIAVLMNHHWPGNVRELINAIEHALVFSEPGHVLDVADLPQEILAQCPDTTETIPGPLTLEAAERQLIAAALRACGGNQSRAAQRLAIERHRLRRRIVHHGLTDLVRARP